MAEEEFSRYLDAMLERHAAITQELIMQMQLSFSALQAEIAEQREQIRANTAATWAMLDRLGEGPQGGRIGICVRCGP
jgi:hypothetical protein